jgi:transposase
MNELIFPPETQLKVDHIITIGRHLDIYAGAHQTQATCPDCHTVSTKVQARYWRHPQDAPCLGMTVRLHLEVRRFACAEKSCARKTFVESLTGLLPANAHRTTRLKKQHLATAYALGGEAGKHLAGLLGMPISGDTLLREIRLAPEPVKPEVRVVGVDDWAMRKGRTYGTILVDLEKRQPIDLLPNREAADVAAWFQAHPEIEIISRDRGKEYIKAATEGAPQAEQVADRWHLLNNLREAVVTFLQQKPICLQAAGIAGDLSPEETELTAKESDLWPEEVAFPYPEPDKTPSTVVGEELPPPLPGLEVEEKLPITKVAQAKATRHARRRERYERVWELKQAGLSDRAIGRQMKLSRRTVRKYLAADACPQYASGRIRQSKLTPWLGHLEKSWQAGNTNASQLWREIRDMGFSGCLGLVSRWAIAQRNLLPAENRYCRQQAPEVKPALSRQVHPVSWSAQRAAWLVFLDDDKLDDEEKLARLRMLTADPELVIVDRMTHQFIRIIKERQVDKLDEWLKDATAGGLKALMSFAKGIRADLNAVRNALKMHFSNGQVEGQNNRLKFIKRQMYGRAKLDLLRKRVLYRPASPG